MREETLGKRLWRVVYPMLAYNAVSYLVSFVTAFIIMEVVSQGFGMIQTNEAYVDFLNEVTKVAVSYTYEMQSVAALMSIPILMLFMRMDKSRRLAEGTWKTYERVNPVLLVLAALLGFSASYVANNFMLMSGLQQMVEGYEELVALMFKGNLVVELLGLGIVIPIAEELVFRQLMYGRMKEFMDFRVAAVSASLCFGAAHGNMVQAIFSFCLSLLMIYLYERFHTIWAPILFHMVSNILAVLQAETPVLDPFFNSRPMFFGSTAIVCVILIGAVVLIEKFVCSEEIVMEEAEETSEIEDIV